MMLLPQLVVIRLDLIDGWGWMHEIVLAGDRDANHAANGVVILESRALQLERCLAKSI